MAWQQRARPKAPAERSADPEEARVRALVLLTGRDYPSGELYDKLCVRFTPQAAAEAVGADFCGVDVIRTGDGPLVCEVNSNAHIRNLYECTGRDVSYDILRHIEKMVW